MKKQTKKTRTRRAWSQMGLRRERRIGELERELATLRDLSKDWGRATKERDTLKQEVRGLRQKTEVLECVREERNALKKTVEEQTHIIETLRWELREYEEAGTLAYKKKLHDLLVIMKDVLDNPMPEEEPEEPVPQQPEIPKHVWRETTVKCFTCQKPIECFLPLDATGANGGESVRCLRCEREGTFKKDTSGELFPHWMGEW